MGTLIMFAVRRAFSQPQRLRELLDELAAKQRISRDEAAQGLTSLLHDESVTTLPDAAYRFCRDEPGAHVILSGTSSLEHLRENLRSLAHPALPARQRERLQRLFQAVSEVSGQ